jgi:hypothetical protein
MRGLRRRRTLEALELLVIGWEMLRGNLHNSDTILRNVVGDGRAQHFGSSELVDVHGKASLQSRICRRDWSINSIHRHNFFSMFTIP